MSDLKKLADEAAQEIFLEGASDDPKWMSNIIYDCMQEAVASVAGKREEFADGRDHLTVSGTFQSDKFGWSAAGFVPLKITDPAARDLLIEYARRREVIDAAFPIDLNEAIENVPAKVNDKYEPFKTVQELERERELVCPGGKTWEELAEERWEQIKIGEGQLSKVKRELAEAREVREKLHKHLCDEINRLNWVLRNRPSIGESAVGRSEVAVPHGSVGRGATHREAIDDALQQEAARAKEAGDED